MDDRGYWHDGQRESALANVIEKLRDGYNDPLGTRERPVIEIGIGEMVQVVKVNGEALSATFDAAAKNRVTLTPQDVSTPRPYLELAEHVQLTRASGESVKAQVWDNRNGKLILRTLPL